MHRLLVLTLVVLIACDRGVSADISRVEGRTAAVADGAALYASRLWTAPELDSLERAGVRVHSLAVQPGELRVRRGQSLPLARLTITALNAVGASIPGAPIVIEEDSDLLTLTPTDFVARGPGGATLRVRCLLPNGRGAEAERVVPVVIE